MPPHAWLADHQFDADQVKAKISVMRKLGVPYDDPEIQDPRPGLFEQAKKIQERLAKDGVSTRENSELIALIAYLQRLGTDLKQNEASQL